MVKDVICTLKSHYVSEKGRTVSGLTIKDPREGRQIQVCGRERKLER